MARFLLALVALLALTSFARRTEALTAQDIVNDLKLLTQKSQDLVGPAQSINLINGPLIVVNLGPYPQINNGLKDIGSTANASTSGMAGMAPIPPVGRGAEAIFAAFRDFVQVHQNLLNIVIGKAGLFSTAPFVGQPVADALRTLQFSMSPFTTAITNNVLAHTADFTSLSQSLDGTIKTAIKAYDGITGVNNRKLLR